MKLLLPISLLALTLAAPSLPGQDVATSQLLPKDSVTAQPLRTGRAVGTLDQLSPFASEVAPGVGGASFNGDASFLVWQTNVRAGMAGLLEGFEIECSGAVGANIDLRIRMGGGWNTNPVVWSGNYSKTTSSTEIGWLDTSGAGIMLNVGDLFVIEWQGTGTGLWMTGSYVAPPGTPAYPELMFLGSSSCYADCGWRIGFHTYMSAGGPTLSSTPLAGGAPGTLTVTGATPFGRVGFAYSLAGPGPSTVPAGPCGSLTVALSPPVNVLTIAAANGAGTATFTGNVPPFLTGRTIWLQALDLATCTLTNPLAAPVS